MVTCGPEARDPRGCSTRPSRARAVPIFYWHPPWIDQYPKFKFQEMEAVIIIHSHLFLSPCLMAPLAASLRSTGMRRLASGSGAHRSGSPPWPCRSRAGRGTFTRQKARCHGCREVAHVDLDRPTTLQSFPRLAPFGLRRRPCHPETAGSRPASLSAQWRKIGKPQSTVSDCGRARSLFSSTLTAFACCPWSGLGRLFAWSGWRTSGRDSWSARWTSWQWTSALSASPCQKVGELINRKVMCSAQSKRTIVIRIIWV